MTITGSQCRAARALVQWPRDKVAQTAGVGIQALAAFESGAGDLDRPAIDRVRRALEEGGAVFIPENGGGLGVRLKFNRKDVRAINKWEGEGGPAGEDDVWPA